MGMAKSVSLGSYYDDVDAQSELYWQGRDFPLAPVVWASQGEWYGGATSLLPYEAYSLYRDGGPPAGTPANKLQPASVTAPSQYQASAADWPRLFWPVQPVPQDTLIIFDWDDTLMCSSAINANQLIPHQALQLEVLLERVLVTSMRLGDTCIVTNADELWVQESARRFAPRVLPLLAQMSVVSARRKYERTLPGDVFAWKRETFREVIAGRKSSPSSQRSGLNLVVLGDSPAEMEAARLSTLGMPHPTLVKTVKFKESPTVDELVEELRLVIQELGAIVGDDKSCHRTLVQHRGRAPLPSAVVAAAAVAAYTPAAVASPALAYSRAALPAAYTALGFGSAYGAPMVYAVGQ